MKDIWNWIRNDKRAVWFEYGVVSLIILLPLLLPGYILTLDLVFTPNFSLPTELSNIYPLQMLLWLLHFVLPGDVIEKILLFLILLLSGVGMHKLLQTIKAKEGVSPEIWQAGAYFAGILYMINPFTYSRFMAGQWMVLLGYALLPFFVQAFIRLVALPSFKSALRTAFLAILIAIVSLHAAGIVLLLALIVIVVASVLRYWHGGSHFGKFIIWSIASFGIFLVVSSFWLVPTLLGQNDAGQAVTHFDQTQFEAFQTTGGNVVGQIAQVIRLQGFWVEGRDLYKLPQSMIPGWGLLFIAFWVVMIIGIVKSWRRNRMLIAVAISCVVVGIILSSTPLIEFLSRFLLFISGYREPQKFVSLIVIGYCILGAFGVSVVIEWASRKFQELGGQAAMALCLLLPLALTPTMLWGFAGQLSPKSYPTGWQDMNEELKHIAVGQKTLFLPWHQYATFDFAGRIIANPAEKFFETPVVISDDPEFKNISPTVPSSEKEQVSAALKNPSTLSEVLRKLNIPYILLSKEKDKIDYSYLDKEKSVRVIHENADLKLYKVEK